jgi:hypothetical protein
MLIATQASVNAGKAEKNPRSNMANSLVGNGLSSMEATPSCAVYRLPEADRYSYPYEWPLRCRPSDGGFTLQIAKRNRPPPLPIRGTPQIRTGDQITGLGSEWRPVARRGCQSRSFLLQRRSGLRRDETSTRR